MKTLITLLSVVLISIVNAQSFKNLREVRILQESSDHERVEFLKRKGFIQVSDTVFKFTGDSVYLWSNSNSKSLVKAKDLQLIDSCEMWVNKSTGESIGLNGNVLEYSWNTDTLITTKETFRTVKREKVAYRMYRDAEVYKPWVSWNRPFGYLNISGDKLYYDRWVKGDLDITISTDNTHLYLR